VIDLQSDDSKTPKQWVNSVYTGVVPIVYKAQRALLTSLVESTLWSFLTITPLMIFVTRSFRAGLVAMIPNVVPVIVIFGTMGWLGIPIDIGSMMTASIALGVAVDDTIHFLSWFRGDVHHYRNRNNAIISCYAKCATPTLQAACISGLGLSVFALSTFTPTQRFGWLMLTILIAGVVAELILLPAILAGPLGKVFEPRQVRHTAIGRMMLIFRYQFRKRFERTTETDKKDKSGSKLQSAA
jgi:predicted RND superfamily exporter protein